MKFRKDSKAPKPTWMGHDAAGFLVVITQDGDGAFRTWTNADIPYHGASAFDTLAEAKEYFS